MKVTVQVIVHPDDDTEASPVVREVFALDRDDLAPDTLGLQLAEAKDLLAAVQDTVVDQQVSAAIARPGGLPGLRAAAPAQGHAHDRGAHPVRQRCGWRAPAGGTAPAATSRPAPSARWPGCCPSGPPRSWPTWRPASPAWSPTASPPTCSARSCRWAGACTPPRYAARSRPSRSGWRTSSARSGPASSTAASATGTSCPARICRWSSAWTAATCTPASHGPARDGWFEVIAGKAIPADGRPACFGFVQTYDTKPKRRLFEVLKAQGMQANQQVTFLTDGGEDVRDLPLLPERPGRAPARLVPPHDADHRHGQHGQGPATAAAGPGDPGRAAGRPRQRDRHAAAAAEVVLLARQRLPRPADRRRPPRRPRHRRALPASRPGCSRRSASSTATSAPTPGGSPTTGNAIAPARPSPPRSSNRPSTR